jgi:tetratricopeptide (TPR) repeat protein
MKNLIKYLQTVSWLLIVIFLFMSSGCGEEETPVIPGAKSIKDLSKSAVPERPLRLPDGSNAEAHSLIEEGISHYNEGHYSTALKYFKDAEMIDPKSGEIHFDIALTLKYLGDYRGAVEQLKKANQFANGNPKILKSNILDEDP